MDNIEQGNVSFDINFSSNTELIARGAEKGICYGMYKDNIIMLLVFNEKGDIVFLQLKKTINKNTFKKLYHEIKKPENDIQEESLLHNIDLSIFAFDEKCMFVQNQYRYFSNLLVAFNFCMYFYNSYDEHFYNGVKLNGINNILNNLFIAFDRNVCASSSNFTLLSDRKNFLQLDKNNNTFVYFNPLNDCIICGKVEKEQDISQITLTPQEKSIIRYFNGYKCYLAKDNVYHIVNNVGNFSFYFLQDENEKLYIVILLKKDDGKVFMKYDYDTFKLESVDYICQDGIFKISADYVKGTCDLKKINFINVHNNGKNIVCDNNNYSKEVTDEVLYDKICKNIVQYLSASDLFLDNFYYIDDNKKTIESKNQLLLPQETINSQEGEIRNDVKNNVNVQSNTKDNVEKEENGSNYGNVLFNIFKANSIHSAQSLKRERIKNFMKKIYVNKKTSINNNASVKENFDIKKSKNKNIFFLESKEYSLKPENQITKKGRLWELLKKDQNLKNKLEEFIFWFKNEPFLTFITARIQKLKNIKLTPKDKGNKNSYDHVYEYVLQNRHIGDNQLRMAISFDKSFNMYIYDELFHFDK